MSASAPPQRGNVPYLGHRVALKADPSWQGRVRQIRSDKAKIFVLWDGEGVPPDPWQDFTDVYPI